MTSTSTSLGLIALLKSAISRSGMEAGRSLSGLTSSAKALRVAGAAHAIPQGAVLYVVPGDRDIEDATADIRFFLSAIEGHSDDAVERLVLPFPSHEVDPYRGMTPHPGVTAARAGALHGLASGSARVIVASAAALAPRVSTPRRLLAASIDLKPGTDIAPTDLGELLIDAGFSREDPADEHGEFAIRGGIVDLFPASEPNPVRLEFIGDTIESMRAYDAATQRSIKAVDRLTVVSLRDQLGEDRGGSVFDYLARAKESRVLVSEPDEVRASSEKLAEQIARSYADLKSPGTPPEELLLDVDTISARLAAGTSLMELGLDEEAGASSHSGQGVAHVRSQPAVELHGRIADWVAAIRKLRADGETVLFVAASPGRAERTIELLKEYEVLAVPVERADDARYAAVLVATGNLSRGFRLPDAGLQIYAESDVFDEDRRAPERRRSASKAFLSDLRDLKVGDLVVHVDHGIGAFVGLKQIGVGDATQEFLELRYEGDDKLFVPVERLDLVQKYTGATRPPLDRGAGRLRRHAEIPQPVRHSAG